MERNNVTFAATVVQRCERAVLVNHGLPSRPVVIPLANVDAAPISGNQYQFTMSRELAKEIGLTV